MPKVMNNLPEQGTLKASSKTSPEVSSFQHGLAQISIIEGKSHWKKATKLIKIQRCVQGKVNVNNKMGSLASELSDSDPLKIISLSSQRALQSFGRAQSKCASNTWKTREGSSFKIPTPSEAGVVEFEACPGAAKSTGAMSPFKVRQPAFKCHELFNRDFARIRSAFGISEREFYAVLGLQEKRVESSYSVIGSGNNSGKSQSFFLLSSDQRFLLKSCTKRDVKTLTAILQGYADHVESCKNADGSNESLLPRMIGLYKLEFYGAPRIPNVTMVVMTNFFAGVYEIHCKYDLKGSTYKRTASEKERKKKSPVYKDLDWMAQGRKITFPSKDEINSIRKRLEKDTAFLSSNNLIDYSLLVGVHERANNKRYDGVSSEAMHVVRSVGKTEVRYFGIVDILTPYLWPKKLETICKRNLACRRGISCRSPKKYRSRFMEFCENEVFACE